MFQEWDKYYLCNLQKIILNLDKKQAYIKNMLNIFKCMESVMLRRCLHIAFTHFNEAHSKHIKDNFQRKRHHNHEQDKKK